MVSVEDGTLKLGINVDHLDGQSGLLLRRVDPDGLVHQHNLQALGWESGARNVGIAMVNYGFYHLYSISMVFSRVFYDKHMISI